MSDAKKRIRAEFAEAVFARDGHRCVFCICRDALDAHHITDRNAMPAGGYVKENGVTLCPEHHVAAEAFHQSGGASWEPGFHPDELYAKIGSSAAAALAASERLAQRLGRGKGPR